jgi:primosomal protein N'
LAEKGQTLIVYPDLWTMYMMTDISLRTMPGVLFIHSSDTQVKKDKAFWQIKRGLVKYILVTHAELFQDFHSLQHITLVHPYKRYYANQQDPRYKTPDVLKYLADSWKIALV